MKTWMICGLTLAMVGTGFYLTTRKPPAPLTEPVIPQIDTPIPAAAPQPESLTLTQVVDVTDIDSLLDPPPIPVAAASVESGPMLIRVGYEEPAAVKPAETPVVPIPKAAD
jgi:hypothetical protein